MAFRVPSHQRPDGSRPLVVPRWPRLVLPIVIIVVVVIILISVIAGIWTDYLWYSSVSETRVFTTTFATKWLLFGVVAVLMMGAVGANLVLAYRLRPIEPPTGPEHQGVEAYRQAVHPHRRGIAAVVVGLIGLIAGLVAAGGWQTWLLFINRVPFGVQDPQFHLDLSFYINVYPFLRMVLSFLFVAVLLSLILAAVVHVLYGGLRLARRPQATTGARAHLFVLAGVFVLLKAIAYWVDRYGITFSQRGIVQSGGSYTDVHALLPAKTALAVIAVICAILFFAGAIRRRSLLAGMGFGLLVLSAVLIGGVYPFVIQQFVVTPNQQAKERPYIAREIRGTRAAYGVANVKVTRYQAIPSASSSSATLAAQAAALPDLRQVDPGLVSPAFQQLQQVKGYYQFLPVLAMDRYLIGSNPQPQDMAVGVRDMAGPPASQANWVNTHEIYTHGYGVVAASASAAAGDGNPQFTEHDIPPTGRLGKFQPRIYFGHEGAGYVIADTTQDELDYPNESTGGQHNNHYHGGGGVPIGSFWGRLLYAIKFRELNIMLSGAITSHSRILYIRDPLARVAKVAPFLTLDGDSYPVIVNGQVLWVVDGYTTTDNYPYSQRINLNQATSNTYSPSGLAVGPGGQVNYIRNSVKATVNAYTGAVHLYQWGTAGPILRAWMKTFPGLISPERDIPQGLRPHLRYPEVLFDAQRQILTQYHILPQQPDAFYGGQNFWNVPGDPSVGLHATISQPPYYLTMDMPGAPSPSFSLITLFTQRGRANLAAVMAVDSNPRDHRDYGKIRILQLPQDTAIFGPQQVQQDFESFPAASKELSLYRQGGSKVILGNLITLPLGGGLLSVEPVYLQAALNSAAYPVLKRVFAYYNGNVGYAPTLQAALAQVFGTTPSTGPSGPPVTGGVSAAVRQDIASAEQDYNLAQAALRTGNLGQYYAEILKMKAALDLAQKAAQESGSGSGSSGGKHQASPSPSPKPTP